MIDIYDFIQYCLDHLEGITVDGKGLDSDGNEFRDDNGQVIYVPVEFRDMFKTMDITQ
jgi:hypothetical protein